MSEVVSRSEIFAGHNRDREANDLGRFKRSSGLDASAQIVAHRKARRDKGISHDRFWWKIIDKKTRMQFGAKGENLAHNFSSGRSLMAAWIKSTLHRRNIRNRKFTHIGIGVAVGRSGDTYYVVHFGGR